MTLEARGLRESERAWRRIPRAVEDVSEDEIRRQAVKVAKEAQRRLLSRVGGYRLKRRPEDIGAYPGSFDSSLWSVYVVRGRGTAAAEWGAHSHPLFGKRRMQSSFSSRVTGAPSREGYLVGPQRKGSQLAKWAKMLTREQFDAIKGELNRAGVPR